jgi:putative toxin-antitoxin system antitoxin component (TIGR02293 family)
VVYSVEDGLPVSPLDRPADCIASDDARFKFRLIPKATLELRRKFPAQWLTSEEGGRLARLAKVFSFALDIYKALEKARGFLDRPHMMLDGKCRLDVALDTGQELDDGTNGGGALLVVVPQPDQESDIHGRR